MGANCKKNWLSLLVVALVAASSAIAGPAAAQAPPDPMFPSVPTNVTATAGDAEVLISWQKGATGDCETSSYYAEVYEVIARPERIPPTDLYVFVDESTITTGLSWHLDGLKASTNYAAYAWAYSIWCDEWSETGGEATFTTTATDDTDDPVAPVSNAKKQPTKVVELTATPVDETSVTLSWKPNPKTGRASKRCQITPLGGGLPNNYKKYNFAIENMITGEWISTAPNWPIGNIETSADPVTVTIDGLESGADLNLKPGQPQYEAMVSIFSPECGEWSLYRYVGWVQP